ncbi:unnamed protein product [Cyprideis torosa]|uniref:Uncharacterized protein n=1 Tax=Cyprideis torosa TaxID=163714 RepID=A0A7R8W110_9CRUS|nr:unnamed protein product [Cyprideis torosa]CAG0880344.1 unnamed protein product [Cyprideis torosa]
MKDLSGSISFRINGKQYDVDGGYGPTFSLNSFIREVAQLMGTKFQCTEGGCGSCVVHVRTVDGVDKAINSCLMPLYSCDGLEVTTVEGLGNKKRGYHPIQQHLAEKNGTQCGYCSSGMVMNMYGLLQSKNGDVKMAEVEDNFGGNICRCTGYRPIMDAMKGFAKDAPESLKCNVDIEDLCLTCPHRSEGANGAPNGTSSMMKSLSILTCEGAEWKRPTSLKELRTILNQATQIPYRLVAGNTGTGVFKNEGPYKLYIDIKAIPELSGVTHEPGKALTFGASVTLTKMVSELKHVASSDGMFAYGKEVSTHIRFIANPGVRNAGTWAGNLMMKRQYPAFPSDLYVVLEAIGAKIIVGTPSGEETLTVDSFLKFNMNGCWIQSLTLPSMDPNTFVFRSFKIMPRFENAHAYVNAAFMLPVVTRNSEIIVQGRPSLCFGGIRSSFTHAVETETYLENKSLSDETVVQSALRILGSELIPDSDIHDASPEYRRELAVSLLYKTILGIIPEQKTNSRVRSGGKGLERPDVYQGSQDYALDERDFPVGKPTVKLEAHAQTSGEAEYVNDIPPFPRELQGAFVLSSVGHAELEAVDASAALAIKGVVMVVTANDIPGINSFMEGAVEEVLCSKNVLFAGQPVALVLAKSRDLAIKAAKLVKVKYSNVQKPILSIRDALDANGRLNEVDKNSAGETSILKELTRPGIEIKNGDPIEDAAKKATRKITGTIDIGSQHHFYLETQVSVSVPIEDGMNVFCATQWMDQVQAICSKVLNWPNHKFNISVRRLGGGYGGKITRPNLLAAASALGAYLTNRPVRICLDLESNLQIIGKRLPYHVEYEAGFDDGGKLAFVSGTIYGDVGCSYNENVVNFSVFNAGNAYYSPSWHWKTVAVRTNTPSNTWTRAPGTTEGIAFIEHIMEHIAVELKKDPLEVRQVNFLQQGQKRIVGEELQANRWKKQGLSVVPMLYAHDDPGFMYPILLSIYHEDGTVAVSHGGIEMGQGINTKVAQVAARELNIPLELVQVKPSNNLIAANSSVTGGSYGSELCCQATIQACRQMNERLAPLREKDPNLSWRELIKKAHTNHVELTVWDMYSRSKEKMKGYIIWGVTATHVEVDILTGEKMVRRVDLIEDAGRSISPLVDIGQVEGAFVMGLGYWLQESVKYDPETGKSLAKNTWEYKPPLAKDVPADFNITLLPNTSNTEGVLRSKATGEPPLCMSVSTLFAVKAAIDSARIDSGNSGWWEFAAPATNDNVRIASLTKVEHMTFTN